MCAPIARLGSYISTMIWVAGSHPFIPILHTFSVRVRSEIRMDI